jgi:Flp pilus assembly protein TadD
MGADPAVAVLGIDIAPGVNPQRPDYLRALIMIGPAWDVVREDGSVPGSASGSVPGSVPASTSVPSLSGTNCAVLPRGTPRSRRVRSRWRAAGHASRSGRARTAIVRAIVSLAGFATCLLALASCAHRAENGDTRGAISTGSGTPAEAADHLNRQAADVMATDASRARALLQRALDADPFHGPAHNNMGVVHLAEGRLNEAAAAFARARRLMPDSAEPRVNLGLTFERAQRFDDAREAYEAALAVSPHDAAAMLALTRLEVRTESTTEATRGRLREIALSAEREEVREWARVQSLRLESRESRRRVVPQ